MAFVSDALIAIMLDESVNQLRDELKVLEFQLTGAHRDMYLTHDGEDTIIVYCPIHLKAYIPKKYNGWPIETREWTDGNMLLDIDDPIDLFVY